MRSDCSLRSSNGTLSCQPCLSGRIAAATVQCGPELKRRKGACQFVSPKQLAVLKYLLLRQGAVMRSCSSEACSRCGLPASERAFSRLPASAGSPPRGSQSQPLKSRSKYESGKEGNCEKALREYLFLICKTKLLQASFFSKTRRRTHFFRASFPT